LLKMVIKGHNYPIHFNDPDLRKSYDAIRSTLETANRFAILTAFAV
jgi:hypothetical protein